MAPDTEPDATPDIEPETEPDVYADNMPLVFSVQHFCLHDGPGTRSLVFFKGCPLRCAWCQNPESWQPELQLGHKSHLCIVCGRCVDVCPTGAIERPGLWSLDRCDLCLRCVDQCPAEAMVRFGEPRSIESLHEELRLEYPVYRRSGGGVTFSGGEPTMFPEFVGQLAERLHDDQVHVAIETCGLFALDAPARPGERWASMDAASPMQRLLGHVDLVLFDIKLFDDAAHRRACGAGNRRIKENLATLARAAANGVGPCVWPRMPVIPSVTDTAANVAGWCALLRDLGLVHLTLVPYHKLGASKRDWLRGVPPAPRLGPLSERDLARCHARFAEAGIATYAPGEEPWPAVSRTVCSAASSTVSSTDP